MAEKAFLRYSHRVATQRTGGRYDLRELWQVPGIEATGGGRDEPAEAWQHEALNAEELPALGDANRDGGYICTAVVARSLDDQGTADVDVTYVEDPLTLPTEINYFGQAKPKPAWQGIAQAYGGPTAIPAPDSPPQPGENALYDDDSVKDIRNSAGDRYNPPVQYEVPLERIEITFRASLLWHDTGDAGQGPQTNFTGDWERYLKRWNVTDFEVTQKDPDNADNDSTRTFPAGTLLFYDKRAPLVKEPYFHRLVTCIFLYDPEMWCQRLPDMGPRAKKYLATRGSQVVQIEPPGYPKARVAVTDTMGRPFGGSAELDGEGNQMIPDSTGKMPSAVIYMWWPVNDDGELLSAEFDDLQMFTRERAPNV